MKAIVITGSTRGIGYGLADAFLTRGHAVIISGRTQESVSKAITSLTQRHLSDHIYGYPCEVTDPAQLQALWDAAIARFGKVEIWINNVGISHPLQTVWELPKEMVDSVVATNLMGTLYGSQVAIRGMLAQGEGHLYNMEGLGSDGQVRPELSVYGTSKAAVTFLTKALTKETENTPVKVSRLSPGVVITELATAPFAKNPDRLERTKRVYNIIGDKVETVAPWMADKILDNDKSGAHIAWLTPPKIAWRFMTAGLRKRDLFSDEAV